MEYELSQHARDMLAEREIRVAWLEQVLRAPERVEPDRADPALEHRLGRISQRGNRVLRVILHRSARPARVVTAYFDRSARGKP